MTATSRRCSGSSRGSVQRSSFSPPSRRPANAIANQLYVVNLNAAAPTALGRSLIVDPEGLVRVQAAESEELLTDALDLDAVTRVRELGTAHVSRMWEQILRLGPEIELPMYGGASVKPRPGR